MVAAPSAAAATSSMDAPMLAWTAARIAPSTSGASLMRTRARSSALEVLEGELQAERRAAEVQQDERTASAPPSEHVPDGCGDASGRWCPGVHPRSPGGGHGDVVAGDLRDHVAQAPRRASRCGRPGPGPPIAPPFVPRRLLVGGDARPSGHQEESKTRIKSCDERVRRVVARACGRVAARSRATYTRPTVRPSAALPPPARAPGAAPPSDRCRRRRRDPGRRWRAAGSSSSATRRT